MTALKSWAESGRRLVDTAMGPRPRRPGHPQRPLGERAFAARCIAGTDIAITAGRFAYVGPDASPMHRPGDAR